MLLTLALQCFFNTFFLSFSVSLLMNSLLHRSLHSLLLLPLPPLSDVRYAQAQASYEWALRWCHQHLPPNDEQIPMLAAQAAAANLALQQVCVGGSCLLQHFSLSRILLLCMICCLTMNSLYIASANISFSISLSLALRTTKRTVLDPVLTMLLLFWHTA